MANKDYRKKTIMLEDVPYRIEEFVGEGAHSTVWCARECFHPYRSLIVKIAREPKGVAHERVENEIHFLREVRHDHIPKLLGSGIVEQCVWLAMPYYKTLQISFPYRGKIVKTEVSDIRPEGYPTLSKKIPLAYKEKLVIQVLADISKLLTYIAGTNIIHADISPGNIMEKKDSILHRQFVLIDWGASSLIHRYPENSFGSLHFTAPERLFGEANYKSDLFSLGVLSFYILSGAVPFSGNTGELYYLSIVERNGLAPSDLGFRISSSLDKIIRDLIKKDADQRPQPEEIQRRVEKLHHL